MPSGFADRGCDLDNLKRKIDAGADRAITQFFFSADCFFRFRDDAAAAGIDVEIVPGILPVSNVATTRRFAATCGAAIPHGWTDCSKVSTIFPRRGSWSPRPSLPSCAGSSMPAASATSISTRLNRAELSYAICHLLGRDGRKIMSASPQTLRAEAAKRILIKDGAYGT